jgi:hypothetical protein
MCSTYLFPIPLHISRTYQCSSAFHCSTWSSVVSLVKLGKVLFHAGQRTRKFLGNGTGLIRTRARKRSRRNLQGQDLTFGSQIRYINLTECVYFHTPIRSAHVVAVVEFVFEGQNDELASKRLVTGGISIKLKGGHYFICSTPRRADSILSEHGVMRMIPIRKKLMMKANQRCKLN